MQNNDTKDPNEMGHEREHIATESDITWKMNYEGFYRDESWSRETGEGDSEPDLTKRNSSLCGGAYFVEGKPFRYLGERS